MAQRYSQGIFVTGTDTGVGKTLVTAALVRCLAHRGLRIGIMKPIETGCAEDAGSSLSDAARLQIAAGTADPIELVSPCRFAAPLAPMSAATREERSVDLRAIEQAYSALQRERDVLLVEGIGGALVPLAPQLDVRDLMIHLGLPVLVVGRSALGGVNHARLTLEALASRNLTILALVLNQTEPIASVEESEQQRSTCELLRTGTTIPVLGPLAFLQSSADEWDTVVDVAAKDPAIIAAADLVWSARR